MVNQSYKQELSPNSELSALLCLALEMLKRKDLGVSFPEKNIPVTILLHQTCISTILIKLSSAMREAKIYENPKIIKRMKTKNQKGKL